MTLRRLVALGAVAVLGFTACGDDDAAESEDGSSASSDGGDSAARDDYVAELAGEMEGDPEFPLDATQATCFAEAVVDTVGYEELVDAEIEPTDLASGGEDDPALDVLEENQDDLAATLADCKLSTAIAALLEEQLDASEETLDCMFADVDEEELARALVVGVVGGDGNESGQAFGRALMSGLDGPCAKSLLLDTLVSQGAVPPEVRACLEENIDVELALRMYDAAEQQADPAGIQADLEAALAPCA